MINNQMLEELVSAPLTLLTIKDKDIINQVNSILPYSTGFEINACLGTNYSKDNFDNIPDILDVDDYEHEQRYRIPNGIKGLICLYHVSKQLKLNCELNPDAGIHYHIDCKTDESWGRIRDYFSDNKNNEWILEELDTWKYPGDYNKRGINPGNGNWLRMNALNTAEFRIGEMTFDYNLMLKRIRHCNSIIKRLKDILDIKVPTFEEPDTKKLLDYAKTNNFTVPNKWQNQLNKLTAQLEKFKEKEVNNLESTEDIKTLVNSRLHRIVKPSK